NDDIITKHVVQIFKDSRNIYGQRKIKKELHKLGYQVSRRRIGRIMKGQGLVSKYTVSQYKPTKTSCNESKVNNVLDREFDSDQPVEALVIDFTYARVKQQWHFVCVVVELYHTGRLGYSAGPDRRAVPVHQ